MSRIPNLLLGSFQQIGRAEILTAIPSRNIVDTLVSEAFVNTDNECSKLSTAGEMSPTDFGSDSPPSDLSQGGKSPLEFWKPSSLGHSICNSGLIHLLRQSCGLVFYSP